MLQRLRARSLTRFAEHRAATNNESYDRATFFVRDPEGYGRTASDYINLGLDVAMPYLDYRNILVSFRLSPWSRAMNGWHRQVITEHNLGAGGPADERGLHGVEPAPLHAQ